MLVLKRFFPVAGSYADSVPVEASSARRAPAAPTETAYKPSLHGTKTIDPSHAVPPHAPLQTRRLASWPPIPPRAPIRNRYPTPSLPITKTPPTDGRSAAPVDPRSTSPAFKEAQLEGAKYDLIDPRSGESCKTESLYPNPDASALPVTTYTLPSEPMLAPCGAQMLAPRVAATVNTCACPPPSGTPTTYPRYAPQSPNNPPNGI